MKLNNNLNHLSLDELIKYYDEKPKTELEKQELANAVYKEIFSHVRYVR